MTLLRRSDWFQFMSSGSASAILAVICQLCLSASQKELYHNSDKDHMYLASIPVTINTNAPVLVKQEPKMCLLSWFTHVCTSYFCIYLYIHTTLIYSIANSYSTTIWKDEERDSYKGWREGSQIKTIYCPDRGSRLNSQHQCQESYNPQ